MNTLRVGMNIGKTKREEFRKGEITIFLSLVLMILLALVFTAIESARVSAARAFMLSTADIGIYSVFAEYDRELMNQYDLFFLDGSYGGQKLNIDRVNERFYDYVSYNIQPEKGLLYNKNINLWNLKIVNSGIGTYILATDYGGEPVRQQAIQYMKATLGVQGLEYILDKVKDTERIQKAQEDYELSDKKIEDELIALEEEKKNIIEQEKQLEQEAELDNREDSGDNNIHNHNKDISDHNEQEDIINPLDFIKEYKNMGILSLVLKDPENISQKSIEVSKALSQRSLNIGNSDIPIKVNDSFADTVLFYEYILEKCANAASVSVTDKDSTLDYQVEYILGGKRNDADNLKSTVHKLLLIREGTNFLYLLGDSSKTLQAQTLATALVGAFMIPGLVEVTKMAILLGWAYAESILDVRSLIEGGKVPIFKNEESWQLSLENIPNLMTDFNQDIKEQKNGLGYKDYLRILLYTESESNNLLKCMDMIEESIRSKDGKSNFKLDQCIAWSTFDTTWDVESVFILPTLLDSNVKDGFLFSESQSYGYNYRMLE